MSEQSVHRPWWKRWGTWVGAAILASVIGWGVAQLLDSERKSLSNGPGVAISVETDPARVYAPSDPNWETYGFISTRRPSELGPPPSELCRKWRTWALDRGGVDADQSRFYVYLQGRHDTAVVISGVDVEVHRRPPRAGTQAFCGAGGASGSPRLIDVDLDASPPAVRYADEGDEQLGRRRLLLTLNGTETETLQLVAHTRRCDCEWRARIHMTVNGVERDAVLDDHGEPFRTSASVRSTHVLWTGKRWKTRSRRDWEASLPTSAASAAP